MIRSIAGIKPIDIYVANTGRHEQVEGGITLREIALALRNELDFEPICARVNNKTEGLHYQVYGPKEIEFLDINSDSGSRAYVRSLCMMLFHVLDKDFGGAHMSAEHSVSNGLYIRIDGVEPTTENAKAIEAAMRRLVERDIDLEYRDIPTAEAIRIFEQAGLDSKVELLSTSDNIRTSCYSLDGTIDSYFGCLAPHTGMLGVFAIDAYHDEGFLLRSFDPRDPSKPAQAVDQPKMFRAFKDHQLFNSIVGVSNVGQLNNTVLTGRPASLINVAEALHDKRLSVISDEITERYRRGGARIILIAGPSSSGKTTTTKRLAIQLMTNLLKPVMISLDDYFVDRVHTPRDANGDYDYESLYALDLEQFNKDLNRILAGEEVELPSYSFELGKRIYKGNRIRLEPGSILLIEGIHGLNPELTEHIEERMKYRVYVSALTTLMIDDHNWIPTTDNRLLRRIIRDFKYRGTSATDTIRRWPSVRRGEEKWIFPYQENADAMFNSSLLFELAVIKDYATSILERVPNNVPEYATAYRLRRFLGYFKQISANVIPPTSLLREFLGGSSFKY